MNTIIITDETDYDDVSTGIDVVNAEYLSGCRLRIFFSDGTAREIDFEPFLLATKAPSLKKYLQPRHLQRFSIINGNLNWNDYEMIFPVGDLMNHTL